VIIPKLSPDRRAKIDEYVRLRSRVAAWRPAANPDAAAFQALQAEIQSWFEKQPAEERILAVGRNYTLPISARKKSRRLIKIPALLKKLGTAWIVEHFTPTLAALDKCPLNPEEMGSFIEESFDGPRIIGEPVETRPQQRQLPKAA
jgi:hypothetical protein